MNNSIKIAALVLAVGGATAALGSMAVASDKCSVAEADRQPIEALRSKLTGQGWQIQELKVDDGCYEAYAIDDKGQKVEVYFDPASFEVVKSEVED